MGCCVTIYAVLHLLVVLVVVLCWHWQTKKNKIKIQLAKNSLFLMISSVNSTNTDVLSINVANCSHSGLWWNGMTQTGHKKYQNDNTVTVIFALTCSQL